LKIGAAATRRRWKKIDLFYADIPQARRGLSVLVRQRVGDI